MELDTTYFKIKYFRIFNNDTKQEIDVDPLLKELIMYKKYYLQTNKDLHYDPDVFFDYLKLLSSKFPNSKFHVYYKYEYFNHDHINTYMNQLSVNNMEIDDKLMGRS